MKVPLGDTYYFKFTSRQFSTGAPFTLAGTPVISVYEENNLTQITAGVSVTADYDSVTGLNEVAIVATGGNGYEAGKYYDAVITTGTVDSVSVVGEVVKHFRIGPAENNAGEEIVDVASVGGTAQTAGDIPALITTVDTVVDAVKVKTDFLPSATAGAAGGVFIAGTNAATVVTTSFTSTFTGNLTGNVGGNVTGTVGSVVGAVGSVAGNVDGNVTGSVGSNLELGPTEVNTEVADVLKTDATAGLSQGKPPENPSMSTAIKYLYWKEVYAKKVTDTNTANQHQVFAADESTILWEYDLTNATNITTQAEATTGA